jgi:hypothetical protein
MKISGHRTESVYRRYDIVVESDLQAAAQKMEQYQREREQPNLKRIELNTRQDKRQSRSFGCEQVV